MGQAIERKWKQNKDKESHSATYCSKSAQDLKAKWHSLRSSVLRYLKKQKEEGDIEIKWPFWEDRNFLRASLQHLDEDNLAWMAEETGNPFSYLD